MLSMITTIWKDYESKVVSTKMLTATTFEIGDKWTCSLCSISLSNQRIKLIVTFITVRTRCVRAEEARHTIRALKNVLDVCEKSGSPFFQIFFLQYARARIFRDDYFRCKKSVYVVRKDYFILFAMPEEEIAQDTDCQALE